MYLYTCIYSKYSFLCFVRNAFTFHRFLFLLTNHVVPYHTIPYPISHDNKQTPEYKPAISDTMRERLLKEASTGLDANQKQTNVILYISIAIAILVALGGSGILY